VCEETNMTKGSKVFRPTDVPESNSSSYPEPFREGQRKRFNRRLGDHAGLTNDGVRVLPGGPSSAPSRACEEGRFVHVIEGEFVLVTDGFRPEGTAISSSPPH
jgi:uncharacterized cupin superfamily protein